MIFIRFRKLQPDAIEPRYATPDAVGMDLYSRAASLIAPGKSELFSTGIAIELPHDHEAQVRGRSGLSLRGIWCPTGTIDPDYRGDIGVILRNMTQEYFEVHPGDRIAQLVIAPIARARLVEVLELSETERGAGGFGSTGSAA